jgi:F0F1-type ATP synthase membrane subunit c/vacuolar-type H+-ATPase subunit K
MSEDKESKAEVIAKSVERISDSKGLAAIGTGLGWGLASFGIALAIGAMYFSIGFSGAAKKWDGHLHPQTKCYDLKQIGDKLFKLNTCTGETVEVNPETIQEIKK